MHANLQQRHSADVPTGREAAPAAPAAVAVGGSGLASFLRARLTSIAHLLTGSLANALIMFASTAIAARTLGASAYGVFALVLTIGRMSERVVRFESWQPLIRFAAHAELEADRNSLSALFLYGLLLDVGAALFAALITLASGYALGSLLGLPPGNMSLLAIFALAIALNIRGMPTAALRLTGQFRTLAYVQIFSAVLRLALAAAAMALGAGLFTFVVVWTAVQIVDSLVFLWLGFGALRSLRVPNPLMAERRGLAGKFPGFMGFAFSTNLSSTLRTLTQEADTLLVGAVAGNAWAGFYFLAKRMAKVAEQVGSMVQAVAYPDLARLWAQREVKAFRHLTARIQLVLTATGLGMLAAVWLLGDWVIRLALGEEFAASYPLLATQVIAVVLILHAAPSRSALLAMNRPSFILAIAVIATSLFFAVAWLAMPSKGALGANFAHVAFASFTAVALDIAWWRNSAKRSA